MRIVGVDGCKAGWFAVWATLDPASGRLEDAGGAVFPAFPDLCERLPDARIVAVDIPIGLPERIDGSGRVAEQAARRAVPGRAASLFSMPARCAVYGSLAAQEPYARVCALARATSDPPRAISRQGFNILPKVIEVDRFLRRHSEWLDRVRETHPEVAFAVSGGAACVHGKSTRDGYVEREARLRHMGAPMAIVAAARASQPKARLADDDILDALACLMVARRIALGRAVSFPDPPARDGEGLPIAIWA